MVKAKQLHLMEIGMQFSDTTAQKQFDVRKLFDHAVEHGAAAIMGSEAGGPKSADLRELLRAEANAARYKLRLGNGSDSWIAVDCDIIAGDWRDWNDIVLDATAGIGRHTNRGVLGVEFDTTFGEHITLLTSHYLTKGSVAADARARRVNVQWNRMLAETIALQAKLKGAGTGLVFYAGDQNTVDRNADTFMGHPLTSCWDELGHYPNTGHGNIDVIASYDRDKRVKCLDAWVRGDKQFRLNTDHKLVEALYAIKPKGTP